jgi:ADP-heptose:LPS heptosyltransferase
MIDSFWKSARSVLLVRLDNLGDVLVTTPAIRAVHQALPDARLTLLCSSVGAQVARLNPDLDEVIIAQVPWMDPWQNLPQSSRRELKLVEQIRALNFDAAIIFTSFRQSPLPAAYLCYLADIPLRLAASWDGSGSLLTSRHRHDADISNTFPHEVVRSLDLVAAIGIDSEPGPLVLDVPESALANVRRLLGEQREYGRLIVVHPGASMPARQYPPDLLQAVVNRLVAWPGTLVMVTGTDEERGLADFVAGEGGAISVAGSLPFPEFCALIKGADALVCGNTGPMHIAAAVGTVVVSLFALTNQPAQWGPWKVAHRQLYLDVPCRICYSRICPYDQQCLRGVTPDTVADAVRGLLAEPGRPLKGAMAGVAA